MLYVRPTVGGCVHLADDREGLILKGKKEVVVKVYGLQDGTDGQVHGGAPPEPV